MSDTGRCVQLEVIVPGNETKVMKHSCSQDLTSTMTAVHAVRDELLSHMKKFPGGPVVDTKNDDCEDEDGGTVKRVAKKRKQSKPSKIQHR